MTLIMASIRLRKNSNGCILKSPRKNLCQQRFLGDSVYKAYTKNLGFIRVGGVLQGRLGRSRVPACDAGQVGATLHSLIDNSVKNETIRCLQNPGRFKHCQLTPALRQALPIRPRWLIGPGGDLSL